MKWNPISEHSDFGYGRLQAITWSANGLVFIRQLQAESGKVLAHAITSRALKTPLFLNCRGLNKVDEYALEAVSEAIRVAPFSIVFTDLNVSFQEDLLRVLRPDPTEVLDSKRLALWGLPIDHSLLNKLLASAVAFERERLRAMVAECFTPFKKGPHRLSSTPLVASGGFDARLLAAAPNQFVSVSIAIAEAVEEMFDLKSAGDLRLLAVSLRASPFAAAVGSLLYPRLEVEIVDHLGPRHSILEEYSIEKNVVSHQYLYIADFVLGGTEIKIAQSYVHQRGSTLRHAIAIGTLLPPDEYGFPDLKLVSLVDLSTCGASPIYTIFKA